MKYIKKHIKWLTWVVTMYTSFTLSTLANDDVNKPMLNKDECIFVIASLKSEMRVKKLLRELNPELLPEIQVFSTNSQWIAVTLGIINRNVFKLRNQQYQSKYNIASDSFCAHNTMYRDEIPLYTLIEHDHNIDKLLDEQLAYFANHHYSYEGVCIAKTNQPRLVQQNSDQNEGNLSAKFVNLRYLKKYDVALVSMLKKNQRNIMYLSAEYNYRKIIDVFTKTHKKYQNLPDNVFINDREWSCAWVR